MGGLDPPIQSHKLRHMPSGFVYILASKRNGTLYTGVTSNLLDRMEQHRKGEGSAFVRKYDVYRLVYFEEYPLYADAIRRETAIKRWKRVWKLELIEKHNPQWQDLLEGWNR
ncbi:MAG TPA: GIY-YIG nuclease family protein [Rhizomicrobium sp.]|nr:GIY-YIG nuclease family protein [Rhizomicrobium sp.]